MGMFLYTMQMFMGYYCMPCRCLWGVFVHHEDIYGGVYLHYEDIYGNVFAHHVDVYGVFCTRSGYLCSVFVNYEDIYGVFL